MQNALDSKADANDIPTKTSDLTNDSGFITSSSLPTKVSDLTNDSGFITNTVNNLTNYYTKTNTYTKSEVDSLIGSVSSLDIQIVQTLPTQDISTSTIYLVPKTSSTNDNYDEYIYVNNSWEHIGSTEVDLSNYYTKTQTDNLLDDKADANSLSTVATTGDYEDLSNIPVIDYTGSSIRVWNLDDGIYKLTNGCVVYYQGNSNISRTTQGTAYLIVFKKTSAWKDFVLLDSPSYIGYTQASAGVINRIIDDNDVTNNLNQTYEGYVLDARQGKILNETKQDLLVSGTNIKTINNQSLLGSGNIDTTGGQSTATDVRINGTTITDDGVANIITESAYNASTNKIATMSDLPPIVEGITTLTGSTINIYDLSNGLYRVPLNCTLYYTSTNYFTASGEDGYLFVNRDYYSLQSYCFIGNDRIITGNTSYNNGSSNESLNNSQIANNLTTTGSGYYVLDAYQGKILKGLIDAIVVPTKTSDLTNDSGFIDGLVILSYGNSTWNDFITAYQKNKVVYCRASSNSNPASGSQTRLAFMTYVNNATSPTEVEFQYYRSVSSHTDSQQGDQVFVYKLTSAGSWTVITRNAFSKVVAGTGLSSSYSNGAITLSANSQTETDPVFTASAASGIASSDITNWNSKQTALVSGTNIKTINNESLLGSGNINITSGGGTMVDMRINGSSIVDSNNVANIATEGTYNATTNKIATMSDLTDKPFYDATYLLRAVGSSLTQEKFEELGDAIQSNTVIKIDDSIVFAIYDIEPQIVISWINYDQFFMIKILGDYDNHPVTYEYNGKELAFADDIPDFFIDGNFLIQSIGNTITNDQYQILEDGIERKGAIIAGATGHISEREKNNTYYIVISCLFDNELREIWVSETRDNHQVTSEQKQLATTSDIPTKTSDLTNDSGFVDNTYHDSTKQNTLVSGTNIKTINNQSILGSGDISVGGEKIPIGTIFEFPTDDATKLPTGYLFCDGSAVSRTQYADLFGVIGTIWGAGDGSTTFNLPTKEGLVTVGVKSGDADFGTIGDTLGEKTHTLTISEMPSHSHNFRLAWGGNDPFNGIGYATNITGDFSDASKIQNTGGGQAHNNIQPTVVSNFIIKASNISQLPDAAEVVDGYSVSTTDAYSANYVNGTLSTLESNVVMQPTVLYNNSSGSNGAITLSDSVVNYSYLEIYFHTNDGANYRGSQKLLASSGAILTSLQYLHCDAAGHYWIKGKEILINGTSIANNGYIETGTNGTSAANYIYIEKVLGYK